MAHSLSQPLVTVHVVTMHLKVRLFTVDCLCERDHIYISAWYGTNK